MQTVSATSMKDTISVYLSFCPSLYLYFYEYIFFKYPALIKVRVGQLH